MSKPKVKIKETYSRLDKKQKLLNRKNEQETVINILNCFILPTRPEIMCRVEGKPKLEK